MKNTYALTNSNQLKKIIKEVNKHLCKSRGWSARNLIEEEDIKRVCLGNYAENHPVDKIILIELEPYKLPKRKNCILDADSPSYPPEPEEYLQCGCASCLRHIKSVESDTAVASPS